jgi:hypothetical protein
MAVILMLAELRPQPSLQEGADCAEAQVVRVRA